jgi:hypothetical protein
LFSPIAPFRQHNPGLQALPDDPGSFATFGGSFSLFACFFAFSRTLDINRDEKQRDENSILHPGDAMHVGSTFRSNCWLRQKPTLMPILTAAIICRTGDGRAWNSQGWYLNCYQGPLTASATSAILASKLQRVSLYLIFW